MTADLDRDDDPAPRRRRRRVTTIVVVLAVALIAIIGWPLWNFLFRVGEGVVAEPQVEAFYTAEPSATPAAPGTVVRAESIVGAPEGSRAWRIAYHSTDESGADVLVSGSVVVPDGDPPEGGRTVVAWAHPTTGTAPRCAPSSGIAPFDLIEGLEDLIADGYAVVATDYAGMGLAGPPSFLLGATESSNVLDIVRAARTMPEAEAADRVFLWGHSQGGHAALFAAQRASTYAPELDVLGVAVAAPASDLTSLLADDIDDVSGVTIGAYAFDAYATAYAAQLPPDPLSTILTPDGAAAVPKMADLCLLGQNRQLHEIARPLVGGFLSADPSTAEGWSTLLVQNSPSERLSMPLFVAQGAKDTLIRPEVTAAYVADRQADGTPVTSEVYPNADHATVALTALPDLRAWMREQDR